jgi:hypothetical protein
MEVQSSVKHRRFRAESEIRELLAAQRQSGLSVKSFCLRHSIAPGSFHNWKKRYEVQGLPAANDAFAAVQVGVAGGLFAEVNGIRLYQPVSAGYLKELAS